MYTSKGDRGRVACTHHASPLTCPARTSRRRKTAAGKVRLPQAGGGHTPSGFQTSGTPTTMGDMAKGTRRMMMTRRMVAVRLMC